MPDLLSRLRHCDQRLGVAAFAVLLTGIAYYTIWRVLALPGTDLSYGSYPSLVHTLSPVSYTHLTLPTICSV